MRKLVALMLCLSCVFALAACTASANVKTDATDKEIEDALNTLKDYIDNATKNEDGNSDGSSDSDSFNWDWGTTTNNETVEAVDPKTVDYSKIDLELPDDGSMMKEVMNDIQSGKYDNKVIKVKGIMSTSMMDPTTNSVMQYVGEGTKFGFQWKIVDANESTTYPADDSQIELVGVIISEYIPEWGMNGHYMYVLPENIQDLGYPEN